MNVGGATSGVAEDSNGTWRLGKAPMETNKTEGIGTKTNINNLNGRKSTSSQVNAIDSTLTDILLDIYCDMSND